MDPPFYSILLVAFSIALDCAEFDYILEMYMQWRTRIGEQKRTLYIPFSCNLG